MAIKELEMVSMKIVSVVSMDATIIDRNPGPNTRKKLKSFIGKTYKIETSSDSLKKCIIENEVVCYEDLKLASLNKIKGGTFNPANLVR